MNARENTLTPLRNLIAIHLDAAGESPADKIAKAIGKADYPSVVIKELNAMRTDGLIECEQRGKKKEMAYWLSVPVSQVTGIEPPAAKAPQESTPAIVGCLPAGITEGTRAAQIWSVLPDHGEPPISAREIAARAQKVVGLIAPVLTTMHQRGQIARVSESSEGYLYTRTALSVATEPQPAEGNITGSSASDVVTTPSEGVAVHQPAPDAAVSLSAAPVAVDDTHQLDDINALFNGFDVTELPPILISCVARLWPGSEGMFWEKGLEQMPDRIADIVENLNTLILERDETARQFGILKERHDSYEHAIGEIHRACADAGIPEGHVAERVRKLAEMVCTLRMTTNALAEDPAVDLQDAATGYLIRVPKRRPRVVTKPETARAAALAAAKVAGGAEVMALVPVGRAVRGAEWRDA